MDIDDRVAQAVEKAFNKYLQYQSQKNDLSNLYDKVIGFDITTLNKQLFFIVQKDNSIVVKACYEQAADAMIKGRLADLIYLAIDSHNRSVQAEISGDVKLADQFQKMLASVEFDWEELLVPWIGDAMANEVGKGVNDLISWVGHCKTSFANNTREYIVDEAELVVASKDIELLMQKVDDLRDAVDRCEAKMNRLGY